MKQRRIISFLLTAAMLITMLPAGLVLGADEDKNKRTVYLHAQGENPKETPNRSVLYKDEDSAIYFAIDDPNRGAYDAATNTHKEKEYDLNGYTVCITYDPAYFQIENENSPINYEISDFDFETSDKEDEDVGDSTVGNVPQKQGYFVYNHGSGNYQLGDKTYKTAYITVFYSGGYVPQKRDDQLWYNLASLPVTPIKTGVTEVFIDIDSGDKRYELELFAKNDKDDTLEAQTFDYSAMYGGKHTIQIESRKNPAPPVAVPASGDYVEEVTVELLHDEPECEIYYTTDGSEPNSASAIKYTGPFKVTNSQQVKACAYRPAKNGEEGKYSRIVTYDYTILPDRPYLFTGDKVLISDFYSENSKFEVLVSDKKVYDLISEDCDIYYTFSNADSKDPQIGNNPETEWVKISKQDPTILIDKKRTVRLITSKEGKFSNPAQYHLSITPQAPKVSHESGEYDEKIDVTLSCETEGAIIYYTLDGSDPITDPSKRLYTDIPITIAKDTTLRAVSFYDGVWSEKVSRYYLINDEIDDFGVNAFYPPGVYEGTVNVTLTPNNPAYIVLYHTGDGKWKTYEDVLSISEDTEIIAKAVELNPEGTVKNEGEEYSFVYKIKPLPPEFAPESTQFTNADKITIYTPESTKETTSRFTLYYTLDGSDPTTSKNRIKAEDEGDLAVIDITKYTVVSAAVLKDEESWSEVVTHSYDIVTLKPVKPLTTLVPGHYIHKIGEDGYSTQFMPVPHNTKIYYTVSYDGKLCPDPVPNAGEAKEYKDEFIEIKGNTVIKAVAVNAFGVQSDVGIFSYIVTPEAPKAAPSAVLAEQRLPVVPVDAVVGSTVKYKINGLENTFKNSDGERFYIDTHTGNAYRDPECKNPLGNKINQENGSKATIEIWAELDGVVSDVNGYIYMISDDADIAPPYADKETGIYPEKKIDNANNLLNVKLYSLHSGGTIQYRLNNEGDWKNYTDDEGLLFKEDTILQLRYEKDKKHSPVVSYVYNFVPLPPVITLPSGTYLKEDKKETKIELSADAPKDKNYVIMYRSNGTTSDREYLGYPMGIDHTMSFKAYVVNTDTGRVSENTIHYYIIESGNVASGNVYIAYPYDTDRIAANLLGTGDYADGIKLLTQNKTADIHYYYTYTKKNADGEPVRVNEAVYDITRPIIPTANMDDITIVAWLVDDNGDIIGESEEFKIDFVHLEIPKTSLEESGKVQFPKETKYTLINDYPGDDNIIMYYTTDGSDPTDSDNEKRLEYKGETLTLKSATTIKAVYYSACGTCHQCDADSPETCIRGVWGEVGTYKYTVPTSSGGGGGGGGISKVIDNTRKYTKDIFGNEHPTHIGYINGYPDGSVQPEGNITREEVAAILYRITNHDYEKPFIETGDVFPDVGKGRWSVHNIEYLAEKKVIEGYPDGEFKPSRNLTRAEFAALIYRFTKLKAVKTENPFTDIHEEHWAYEELLALVKSGLIEGYEDLTFRPDNQISRAEVMTVINKLLGRKPLESYVKSLEFNPFNDLYENKWYYVTVLEATITHNYYLNDTGYEYKWEDWK